MDAEIEKGIDQQIGAIMTRSTQIQSQMWVSVGRMNRHFGLFLDQLYATHTLKVDMDNHALPGGGGGAVVKKDAPKQKGRNEKLHKLVLVQASSSATSLLTHGKPRCYEVVPLSNDAATSSVSLPNALSVAGNNASLLPDLFRDVKGTDSHDAHGGSQMAPVSDLLLLKSHRTPVSDLLLPEGQPPISSHQLDACYDLANQWMSAHVEALGAYNNELSSSVGTNSRSPDDPSNAGDNNNSQDHEGAVQKREVQVFWSKQRIADLLNHAEMMAEYMRSVVDGVESKAEAIVKHSRDEVNMWKRIVMRKEGIIQTLLQQRKEMTKRESASGFRDCFIRY